MDYNDEPVHYCKDCMNIAIKTLENSEIDYCTFCGSSNIGITDIENWKELYREMYKKDYVTKSK